MKPSCCATCFDSCTSHESCRCLSVLQRRNVLKISMLRLPLSNISTRASSLLLPSCPPPPPRCLCLPIPTTMCMMTRMHLVHTEVTVPSVLQVKEQLQGTHTQSVWSAQEPESSMSLPSFNAYPQLSVTAAGEYLMMLPQLLESLLTDSEEGVDTEWLDKVTCGCLHNHCVCCAVQTALCCAALCCAALRCAVLRCSTLDCAVVRFADLHRAVLRCAVPRYAAL